MNDYYDECPRCGCMDDMETHECYEEERDYYYDLD